MNKAKITILFIFIIIMCAIVGKIILDNKTEETVESSSTLSNKKICWGIKRADNNEQPDVGEENRKILEANNGICMGNSEKRYIYLTFDEGYEAGYTSQILDVLNENEVTATFFITGHYLNTQEELVKRMLEEGHEVGNHTVNHPSMPEISEEQLKAEVMDLHQAVYEKFAYEMKYIRPPKGEFSERTISLTETMGYKTVMWSFAYSDWDEDNQPSEDEAKNKILSNVHNGEIMLLHANSKTNTEILDDIIKEIKNMGYEFKSLNSFE